MNKIIFFFKKQFKFSILEISLAGILTALTIVLKLNVFTLNFGAMRAGLAYPMFILMGLILKPFLGAIAAILADNLSLLINGSIWLWTYAIIPLFIIIIVSVMKWLLEKQNDKTWLVLSLITSVVVISSSLALLIVYNDYSKLALKSTKAIIWIMFGLLVVFEIVAYIWFFKTENKNKKDAVNILNIVTVIVVLIVWMWGPFAMMEFFKVSGIPQKTYDVFLIPRLLKTPIIIPLYSLIIVPVYKASQLVLKKYTNKW